MDKGQRKYHPRKIISKTVPGLHKKSIQNQVAILALDFYFGTRFEPLPDSDNNNNNNSNDIINNNNNNNNSNDINNNNNKLEDNIIEQEFQYQQFKELIQYWKQEPRDPNLAEKLLRGSELIPMFWNNDYKGLLQQHFQRDRTLTSPKHPRYTDVKRDGLFYATVIPPIGSKHDRESSPIGRTTRNQAQRDAAHLCLLRLYLLEGKH